MSCALSPGRITPVPTSTQRRKLSGNCAESAAWTMLNGITTRHANNINMTLFICCPPSRGEFVLSARFAKADLDQPVKCFDEPRDGRVLHRALVDGLRNTQPVPPAKATISASMRSVCVYGRPCGAFS